MLTHIHIPETHSRLGKVETVRNKGEREQEEPEEEGYTGRGKRKGEGSEVSACESHPALRNKGRMTRPPLRGDGKGFVF